MKAFVYEHLCAVTTGGDAAAESLRVEGRAMLSAVLADFRRIPSVDCVTLINHRSPLLSDHWPIVGFPLGDEKAAFLRLAGEADFTLVIAPELESILLTRCRWVQGAGGRLLGPSEGAVALTADKLALAKQWKRHSIHTPVCSKITDKSAAIKFPCVLKPRYGAGSQTTYLLENRKNLELAMASIARQEDFILQPFVPGRAASVALLIGPQQTLDLPPTAQYLSSDGRFRYLGGALPLRPALAERARRLALRAVAAVPGLLGYVGVDLVLGPAADGSGDWAIEINPRLTTSYVGLRALCETNLAEAMLALISAREPPKLNWRQGSVRFWADGRTELMG